MTEMVPMCLEPGGFPPPGWVTQLQARAPKNTQSWLAVSCSSPLSFPHISLPSHCFLCLAFMQNHTSRALSEIFNEGKISIIQILLEENLE